MRIPLATAGHWVDYDAPADQWECFPPGACRAAADEEDVRTGTCADGYEGRKCERCAEGHYRYGVECRPCGGAGLRAALLVLFLAVFLATPLTLLVSQTDKYLDQANVMVNYLQMLGGVTLLVGFSDRSVVLLKFVSLFSLNVEALEPACWGWTPQDDFREKFVFSWLLPAAFLLYLLAVFLVHAALGRGRRYAASVDQYYFDDEGEPLYFLSEVLEYEGMDADINTMRYHAQMMLDRALFNRAFARGTSNAVTEAHVGRISRALVRHGAGAKTDAAAVDEDEDFEPVTLRGRGGELADYVEAVITGSPPARLCRQVVHTGADLPRERFDQATHVARAVPTQAALEGAEGAKQTRTLKLMTNATFESILVPARSSDVFKSAFFLFWNWSLFPSLLWLLSVFDCARLLDCSRDQDVHFLEREPSRVCFFAGGSGGPTDGWDRTTWQWLAALAVLGLVFWVVGWVVVSCLVLYWFRPEGDKPLVGAVDRARAEGNMGLYRKIASSSSHVQWSFLFRDYDDDKYWWEAVEAARKVGFALCFALPVNLGYLAAMLIQLGAWVVAMLLKPHKNNAVSAMEGWCSGTSFVVLFTGFLSYVRAAPAYQDQVYDAQFAVLVLSLAGAVLFVLVDTFLDAFPAVRALLVFTYVMRFYTDSPAEFREAFNKYWRVQRAMRGEVDDESSIEEMKISYRAKVLFKKDVAQRLELLLSMPTLDAHDRQRLFMAVNRMYGAWQVVALEEARDANEWHLDDGIRADMKMSLMPYMAFVMRERERVTLAAFLSKAIARTQASRDISRFQARLTAMKFEDRFSRGQYATREMVLRETERRLAVAAQQEQQGGAAAAGGGGGVDLYRGVRERMAGLDKFARFANASSEITALPTARRVAVMRAAITWRERTSARVEERSARERRASDGLSEDAPMGSDSGAGTSTQ